jgi:Arc/MetJ-type ribon-helix-helix transcriptional regulator
VSRSYRRATVTLPRPILARLDRLARRHYRSRSDIVRQALIAYLDPATAPLSPAAFAAARLPEALPEPGEIAALARSRTSGAGAPTTLAALCRQLGHMGRRTAKKRRA